ncbi:glycosyltransferase family 2 protein [Thermaerobacter litoralis]
MDKPLVSIVIDNYNYGRFLRDAIESALNQTYTNVEVVVVDDGSTDHSREIIEEYASQGKVIPVFKDNGGQASAFNAGFARSSGEIVIFLDSDDMLTTTTVETVVNSFRMEPLCSKVQYLLGAIDEHNVSLAYTIPSQSLPNHESVLRDLLTCGRYITPPTSGNAYSRTFLIQVMPIPEEDFRISADGYLLTLSPLFGKIISINQVLGMYRVHGSNAWTGLRPGRLRFYLLHDLQKAKLLKNYSHLAHATIVPTKLLSRNPNHLAARLASMKLEPTNHPFKEDTLLNVTLAGLKAVSLSALPIPSKLFWLAWFIVLSFCPNPWAKDVANWLFQPHMRPKAIRGVIWCMKKLWKG